MRLRTFIPLLFLSMTLLSAATSQSQEPPENPPAEAPVETPTPAEVTPGPPPAGTTPELTPAEAPAGPTPAEASAGEESLETKSFLRFVFEASPVLFFIILALSVYLVTTIVNGFLAFRARNVIPPATIELLNEKLKERQFKEAYEGLKGDTSLFARALKSGLEHMPAGWDSAMDAMLTTIQDDKIRFEHKISPIAVLGQLGPLIGLFGTVVGMILAFMSISTGGQPKPSELASEIAIALCATMEGLVLALPAIWFYAVLKNRVHRLIFDVESLGETYLRKFSQAVKK